MVFVDSKFHWWRQILIVGYLDNNPKNISVDNQQDVINQSVQQNMETVDVFFCATDIKSIKNNINTKNNTLIIANIACLGNKLATIVENIEFLISNGFELISVKENLKLNSSQEALLLIQGIKLSIDIRNSMVSTITKKALSDKKNEGVILGFPKGKKCKNTILERNKQKITQMLKLGKSKRQIADEIGCSMDLIFKYLQQNPELKGVEQ